MIDMSHFISRLAAQSYWYSKYLGLWVESHKEEMYRSLEADLSSDSEWLKINPITSVDTAVLDGLRVKVLSFDEGVSHGDKNESMSFDELMRFEGK